MANEKYLKLVSEKNWKKLAKLAEKKNVQDAVDVAEAVAAGKSEEARNILVDILARPEREAKVAAVKALGSLRYDPESQMERLRHVDTTGDSELEALVKASVESIRAYVKDKKG